MTFGIPVEDFPVSSEGEIRNAAHLKWMQRQSRKEDIISRIGYFPKIELPGRNDIIVGRGKPFHSHHGNIMMHQLIEQHQDEYESAGRGEKTLIAKNIVKKLREKGRFLTRDSEGWWVEAVEEAAVDKVLSGFRNSRFRKKAEEQRSSIPKSLDKELPKRLKTDLGTMSPPLPAPTESSAGCFTNSCCSEKETNPRNPSLMTESISFINHD